MERKIARFTLTVLFIIVILSVVLFLAQGILIRRVKMRPNPEATPEALAVVTMAASKWHCSIGALYSWKPTHLVAF